MGQSQGHMGFSVHNTAATRGQYLALSKAWRSSCEFRLKVHFYITGAAPGVPWAGSRRRELQVNISVRCAPLCEGFWRSVTLTDDLFSWKLHTVLLLPCAGFTSIIIIFSFSIQDRQTEKQRNGQDPECSLLGRPHNKPVTTLNHSPANKVQCKIGDKSYRTSPACPCDEYAAVCPCRNGK